VIAADLRRMLGDTDRPFADRLVDDGLVQIKRREELHRSLVDGEQMES
jgi:hypothetical protein